MISPQDRLSRGAVWAAYSLFAMTKVANCCWRIFSYTRDMDQDMLYTGMSYLDAIAYWTGALSDVVCCYLLYKRTTEILKMAKSSQVTKKRGLLNLADLIRKSSLARVVLISTIKVCSGIIMITHLCLKAFEVCPYGFLRGIITTVDYQLYYMDFILTQNTKQQTPQTTMDSYTFKASQGDDSFQTELK